VQEKAPGAGGEAAAPMPNNPSAPQNNSGVANPPEQ
jgi:hypothetical protein